MDLEGVREALHQEPFKPFDICLADGRRVPVRHPDFVAVGKRRIIVVQPDDSSMFIESRLIASLDCTGEHPPRTNRRQKDKT
jgi:hypothetical protein